MPSRPTEPDAQDDPAKDSEQRIRFVFSIALGAVLMLAGTGVVIFNVLNAPTDLWVLGFGVGLILLGGVAALPGTFVPIFRTVVSKLPGRVEPPKIEIKLPKKPDDGNE